MVLRKFLIDLSLRPPPTAMSDSKKKVSKSILEQLDASRQKLHADIILVTLKNGKKIIGKYSGVQYSEETGEGSIVLNGEVINFRDIRMIE